METWKYFKDFGYAGRLCVTCYVDQGPEEVGTQTSTAVGLRAIPYLAFGRGFILKHKSSIYFTYSGRRAVKMNCKTNCKYLGLTAGIGFLADVQFMRYLG
jgi:hypothetical protein